MSNEPYGSTGDDIKRDIRRVGYIILVMKLAIALSVAASVLILFTSPIFFWETVSNFGQSIIVFYTLGVLWCGTLILHQYALGGTPPTLLLRRNAPPRKTFDLEGKP
jgi:hypothetical protein